MADKPELQEDPGRRHFLRDVLASAVMVAAARGGIEVAAPERSSAQTKLTPDEALQELLTGNQRFSSKQMTSFAHDLSILKENTLSKQEPFAAVLGCADSRIPVELVFDQTIGHIFVARVAGNIVTAEIIASLEYAVAVLGVRALLVLGHSNCGAVKAAMKADGVPDRSAHCMRICAKQWISQAGTWTAQSRPTPRFRLSCFARPQRLFAMPLLANCESTLRPMILRRAKSLYAECQSTAVTPREGVLAGFPHTIPFKRQPPARSFRRTNLFLLGAILPLRL